MKSADPAMPNRTSLPSISRRPGAGLRPNRYQTSRSAGCQKPWPNKRRRDPRRTAPSLRRANSILAARPRPCGRMYPNSRAKPCATARSAALAEANARNGGRAQARRPVKSMVPFGEAQIGGRLHGPPEILQGRSAATNLRKVLSAFREQAQRSCCQHYKRRVRDRSLRRLHRIAQ